MGYNLSVDGMRSYPNKTRGLMYKRSVHTKKWRSHFFTSTIRCIKSEMTMEMCGGESENFRVTNGVDTLRLSSNNISLKLKI